MYDVDSNLPMSIALEIARHTRDYPHTFVLIDRRTLSALAQSFFLGYANALVWSKRGKHRQETLAFIRALFEMLEDEDWAWGDTPEALTPAMLEN